MISHTPTAALDAVYFRDARSRVCQVLERARFWLASCREEIAFLTTEQKLPQAYRQAYGKLVALLSSAEMVCKDDKVMAMEEWIDLAGDDLPTDTDLVDAAKETIEDINRAEIRLARSLASAHRALAEHAEQGLIDWSAPFDLEIALELDPGPERQFYATCAEGEPRRVKVGIYTPCMTRNGEEVRNWNMYQFLDGHPLQAGVHGYLAHCILDHSPVPWQLLPRIRAIECTLEFKDCEDIWTAPTGAG